MNKLKTMILCALLTIAGRAAAQTVSMTAGDVLIEAGQTAELTCSLENSMEIAGWQMYLYLPEGVTIACEEEDGEVYYDGYVVLSSRHKRSHTCTVTPTADGGYLIMAYNPSKPTAINGNSGGLVTITLQAANTYSGDHAATIKQVAVSDMNSVQINMENDITILVSEANTTGVMTVKDAAGESSAYDLNGRRVTKTTKGIQIQEGRKVVVK